MGILHREHDVHTGPAHILGRLAALSICGCCTRRQRSANCRTLGHCREQACIPRAVAVLLPLGGHGIGHKGSLELLLKARCGFALLFPISHAAEGSALVLLVNHTVLISSQSDDHHSASRSYRFLWAVKIFPGCPLGREMTVDLTHGRVVLLGVGGWESRGRHDAQLVIWTRMDRVNPK